MTEVKKSSFLKKDAVTPLDLAKKNKIAVVVGAIIASLASGFMANEAFLNTSQQVHNQTFNYSKVQSIVLDSNAYIEEIRVNLRQVVSSDVFINSSNKKRVIHTKQMKALSGTTFQDAIHITYLPVDSIDYDPDNGVNFIAVTQARSSVERNGISGISAFKDRKSGSVFLSMIEPVVVKNKLIGVVSIVQESELLISHLNEILIGQQNYKLTQNISGIEFTIYQKGNDNFSSEKPIMSNVVSDKWILEIWPQVNFRDHLPSYLKAISPFLALILLLGVGAFYGTRLIDKKARGDMEGYAEKLKQLVQDEESEKVMQQKLYEAEKDRLTDQLKFDSKNNGDSVSKSKLSLSDTPAAKNIKHNLSMIIPSDMIKGSRIADSEIHNLTTQHAYVLGQALGSMQQEQGENVIVIGHDGRSGCDKMSNSLMSGILDSGFNVINLADSNMSLIWSGIKAHNAKAGIMIASDNDDVTRMDIRICIGNTMATSKDIKLLNKAIMKREFTTGKGTSIKDNPVSLYIEDVVSDIVIAKPLKVAIEASHSGVIACVIQLFKDLGCEVFTLPGEIGSDDQNQGIETSCLNSLAMNIRSNNADIGIAYDRDADRIRVLDNNGLLVPTNVLASILSKDILEQEPASTIVLDIESGLYLETEVRNNLGSVMYTKGHLDDICRACKTYSSPFGINTDCKINYNDRWHGEPDGIYASARVVEMLSLSDKKLSDMVEESMEGLAVLESRGIIKINNAKAQGIYKIFTDNLGSRNRTHVEGNIILIDFRGSLAWIKLISDTEISLRIEAWSDGQLEKGKDLLTSFINSQKKDLKIDLT